MTLTFAQALWFLPFALPISIWVAWSDLKFMKIPNKAVYALLAVFLVVGLIALPLADYPWRLLHTLGLAAVKQGDVEIGKGLLREAIDTHPQHFEAAARSLRALEANVTN